MAYKSTSVVYMCILVPMQHCPAWAGHSAGGNRSNDDYIIGSQFILCSFKNYSNKAVDQVPNVIAWQQTHYTTH